jgi:hypothetical protein
MTQSIMTLREWQTFIKNPNELISTITNLNSIKAIFLFQDVLSDSYLNNKTIFEMKKYLENLENNSIYIYPSSNFIDLFGSKKYNLILNNKLSWDRTVDRLINIYCYLFINNNNIIVFI